MINSNSAKLNISHTLPYYYPVESPAPIEENFMLFFSVPDFNGSPLAFWKYVKDKNYKTAWIIRDKSIYDSLTSQGIDCCLFDDYESKMNYYQRAKYILIDREYDTAHHKYKGQIYVLLHNHVLLSGEIFCNPDSIIKSRGFANGVKYNMLKAAVSDIVIASSSLMRIFTAASLHLDARKIFVTGLPRHDEIFANDGKEILLKSLPEICDYSHIIGYLPTGNRGQGNKDGKGFEQNIFNLDDLNIERLENLLEEKNAAIIIKLHPVDEIYFKNHNFELPKHCYLINSNFLEKYSIYSILNAFDIMISDASSLANDFLLLDRPIINIAGFLDYYFETWQDQYQSRFGVDKELLTYGYDVRTQEELFDSISAALANPNEHKAKRDFARSLMLKYSDANSCARLLDVIENYDPIENFECEMYTAEIEENLHKQIQDKNIELQKTYNELNAIKSSFIYKLFSK